MTTATLPTHGEAKPPTVQRGFDPFQLMDRMDDDLIRQELEGIASEELVYRVKDKSGKEIEGLSKIGVDECCNILAHRGEVIREIAIHYDIREVAGETVALFQATAARFAVDQDGREVKLDQVIGTKTQALFYEAKEELTLESTLRWGKHKGKTFRALLEQERGYLEWLRDNAKEDHLRTFVTQVLDGEDARVIPGRQDNPFWFEQGSQKALRNARFRLVPAQIRAEVIALAKKAGKVREIRHGEESAPVEEQAPSITAETPLTFGKMRGTKLGDLADPYLTWMCEPDRTFGSELETAAWQSAARAELKRRAAGGDAAEGGSDDAR